MMTEQTTPSTDARSTEPLDRVLNIAAYRFVTLHDLPSRREQLRALSNELQLKGTILISPEGINLFLAGSEKSIEAFLVALRSDAPYADMMVKQSWTSYQPFKRMLVRLKKEIIAFGVHQVDPRVATSQKLQAKQLKEWLDQGQPVHLLDVRNDYEIKLGTFHAAHSIGVENFRDFPKAVESLPDKWRSEAVVMFCTGGIRCEKAGPYLEQQGFKDVYQLDGGILKYFEDVGGDHYDGECFVFDRRVAVGPDLCESETEQCFACQAPLSLDDQQSKKYVVGESCPYCFESPDEQAWRRRGERQEMLLQVTSPLPGSIPYDNIRPINVPLKFDKHRLLDCLDGVHPHVGRDTWDALCRDGRIRFNGQAVNSDRIVVAGERYENCIPMTTEPDVSSGVQILDEDETLIVVNKPAPLPIHPCGRFNRNTLIYWLNHVYAPQVIRVAHRLDANTSGVMLLTRQRWVASQVQPIFARGEVAKTYLARVSGVPQQNQFAVEAPISREPDAGGFRRIDENGLPARTEFTVLKRLDDGTSLLRVVPKTGRTNQIRLHCWHIGTPIIGDNAYLEGHQFGTRQTLLPSEPPMCLHAWKLGLRHPVTNDDREWVAPPPAWAGETPEK
ncbi:MAG: sulfurtransferase [Pirellulaceae bacterium]